MTETTAAGSGDDVTRLIESAQRLGIELDAADTERWLAGVDVASFVQAGSSLKFCRIAEGAADVYPRFGRTMEWDTAAGHAVLLAAGGSVRTTSGQPLGYAKAGFENPPFIAYGGTPSLDVS